MRWVCGCVCEGETNFVIVDRPRLTTFADVAYINEDDNEFYSTNSGDNLNSEGDGRR